MRTIHLVFPIMASALWVAACGEAPKTSPAQKPVQVGVLTLESQSLPAVLEAPGSVQPRDRIVLSSQINGFVREVRIHAGDRVAAGQVLVTLDNREAESQQAMARAGIDEAQAALAEARKGLEVARNMQAAARASSDLAAGTYARYQKLFEAKSASPQELDEVKARRDSAAADLAAKEAMVAAAQDRLSQVEAKISQADAQSRRAAVYVGWTVVKAPSAGRIVERSVDPGSAIFPGSSLVTIESTSRPQVLASLPTAGASFLHNGLEVQVRIPGLSDPGQAETSVKGRIAEIIPLSTPGSHTTQFKVDLPDRYAAVSGSFVKVEIPTGTRQTILVPVQAVRESGQLTGVFIADGSAKARFRLVKMTPYDPERMELLAGAEPGERIVAKLTDQITDGVSLEIRP